MPFSYSTRQLEHRYEDRFSAAAFALAKLDDWIRSGKYPNATSAAKEMEVNRRTVKRDFEFLRDGFNAPLEYSRENNGYFYTEPDFALPLVRMTEGELVALFLAAQLLQQYGATPFKRDIQAAFAKICSWLPAEVSLDLAALGQSLSTRQTAISRQDPKVFRAAHGGFAPAAERAHGVLDCRA